MALAPRAVLIHRRTELDELMARHGTRGQAAFFLRTRGRDLAEVEKRHEAQQLALADVSAAIPGDWRRGLLEREDVSRFLFAPDDIVLVVGQDGLVANTAKYALDRPIVAVNPDPARFDGILLPFLPGEAPGAVSAVLAGRARERQVTLAEARLDDGQTLLAFNDLFLGARTHVSARYRIRYRDAAEPQSSSGVLVSTGAGSTGWLSSVFNMAAGVTALCGGRGREGIRLEWEDPRLLFVVREPFVSRHSKAGIVAGLVEPDSELRLESLMPSGGVIFSDGIEQDFLRFDSGAVAHVRAAGKKARLVVG